MANVVGGTVVWDLDVDKGKLTAGLREAKNEVADVAKQIESNFSGLTNKISNSLKEAEKSSKAFATGLAAIGTAAIGAIGYGAKIAGDLESARQGFVALLGSAEEADSTIARIKKEAATTPFELTGLIAGAQALTAITKDGQESVDILLDVGKAIATSGKGQAELDRVILNLQQISATGKLTAMDIRQFQSAIPMFNDIVAVTGMTAAELQDADNAAELLFDAFKKAGQEGGITAQGFEAQAGTFNQQVSNVKDNITILSSELVNQLGLFDGIKDALGKLNDVLGDHQSIIEAIKGPLSFMSDNLPIIAGAIIGGLTPAIYGLASAFVTMMIQLLPFIAIGAAVGLVVMGLMKLFQNWGAITESVAGVINSVKDFLAGVFNSLVDKVGSAIISIIGFVESMLAPFEWLYSNVVEPILLLIEAIFLRVFYEVEKKVTEILGRLFGWIETNFLNPVKNTVERIFNAVSEFVGMIWNKISDRMTGPAQMAKNKVTDLFGSISSFVQDKWNGIVTFLENIAGRVVEAITKPFREAKEKVEEWAQKIKDAADKINPYHRESPSLVDNVKAGLNDIKDEFSSFGNFMASPTIMPAVAPAFNQSDFGGGGTVNRNITVNIDKVNSQQDVEALVRELGYYASLQPELK